MTGAFPSVGGNGGDQRRQAAHATAVRSYESEPASTVVGSREKKARASARATRSEPAPEAMRMRSSRSPCAGEKGVGVAALELEGEAASHDAATIVGIDDAGLARLPLSVGGDDAVLCDRPRPALGPALEGGSADGLRVLFRAFGVGAGEAQISARCSRILRCSLPQLESRAEMDWRSTRSGPLCQRPWCSRPSPA